MPSLTERLAAQTCAAPDCKRAPAYPDQRFCDTHRLPWAPPWLERARKSKYGLARPLEPAR